MEHSSVPELVDLLSELNDAVGQLDDKINPLLSKVKKGEIMLEGGVHYLEVKQLLLVAYCQAITFYLLLKSEGQPVGDHPVMARLAEIKSLLDKTKQLDKNLQSDFEEILRKDGTAETVGKLIKTASVMVSDSVKKDSIKSSHVSDTKQASKTPGANELGREESLIDHGNKGAKRKQRPVGLLSKEMLKVRASLEEKWKQKRVFSSIAPKPDKAKKRLKPVNGKLETYDDFNDDTMDVGRNTFGLNNANVSSLRSTKLSQLVAAVQPSKPKVISGDDDLPKRDDIGKRRRKHELRVLAGAGIKSEDDAVDDLGTYGVDGNVGLEEDEDGGESEDEFYRQVKQQRAEKLAAKAERYTRTSATPSLPETTDGRRPIASQMEKNRGLTRARKKLTKNRRKKYRHKKAAMRREGRAPDIRKPGGPYGGEASGIDPGIIRSIRFKS